MITRRVLARSLATIVGAAGIGAVTGFVTAPSTKVLAACENDECEQGWFWDSCKPNGIVETCCDMIDDDDCATFVCGQGGHCGAAS